MRKQDLDFIGDLIVMLNLKIDMHQQKLNEKGISIVFGFTEEKRKEQTKKAFELLEQEAKNGKS